MVCLRFLSYHWKAFFSDSGIFSTFVFKIFTLRKKGKRKVQEVPQSQSAALPRHQEEEEIDKTKQAQNQTNVRKAPRKHAYLNIMKILPPKN